MSPSPWQQQQEQSKKSKSQREFMLLVSVLLLMACGGFIFLKPARLPQPAKMSGSAFSQILLQTDNSSSVSRQIPIRFKEKGTVDDRYTVATDPKTGEMLINDALGGMGRNNTSVDGDRAKLANDMLNLNRYAENNRKHLSTTAYYWLKKVARIGMQLAFGTPGLTPGAQPAIKKEILAEFHTISANPDQSFLLNSKYLELEAVFQRPEAAYLADTDVSGTNFLSIDPLSPPLITSSLLTPSLYTTLSATTLEPSMTDLTLSSSPYTYTDATSTLMATPTTLSPTSTLSLTHTGALDTSLTTSSSLSTTTSSKTLSTSTSIGSTSVTTTTAGAPTTTTTSTSSGPTVAEYYHDVLGVPLPTTTSAP